MKVNEGTIKCSIKEGIEFLKKIEIYQECIRKNCESLEYQEKYSENFKSSVYKEKYEDIYKIAMENYDYDILLKDGSFFQFCYKKENKNNYKIKYSFFPNPYIDSKEDYQTFIEKTFGKEYVEIGDEYRDYYEQYVAESKPNTNITPIRYDYDKEAYISMCHPISHFHIGKNENVRLPIDYILLPEMFIQNIIMLSYADAWKTAMMTEALKSKCFSGKDKSQKCEDKILNAEEKKIIYLS